MKRLFAIPIFFLRTLPFKLGFSKVERKEKNTARGHAVKGGITASILSSILQQEIENLNNKRDMRFGGSCLVAARSL